MQKVVFSLDDYCYQYQSCRKYLDILNNYFTNFKCSFFTIPCYENIAIALHPEILEFNYPVEHLIHGCYHNNHEFANLILPEITRRLGFTWMYFKEAKLPIHKIFKAPNWRYNSNLEEVLRMWGWTLAIYSPGYRRKDLKSYEFNWDIGTNKLPDATIIHTHGHTHDVSGPGAGIDRGGVVENIMQLPKDIEFMLISEFLKLQEGE